jgi:type II secretory pathway component PulJ
MKRTRTHGFTILELLLAGAMLGTLMTGLGMYFVSTTDLDRRSQAQADVQDKIRTGVQLLTQDLQTLGSSRYIKGSEVLNHADWAGCDVSPKCLEGTTGTTAAAGVKSTPDSLQGRYITSLLPESEACRKFAYRVTNTSLERSEQPCTSISTNFAELADGILGFDIVYLCSDNEQVNTPACPTVTLGSTSVVRFVRSARFTLIGRSSQQIPNANTAEQYALPSGGQVSCPAKYSCFAMTQDVLMPNLKDR